MMWSGSSGAPLRFPLQLLLCACSARALTILVWASPVGLSHLHHFALVTNILHSAGHNLTLITYNEASLPKALTPAAARDVHWISMRDEAQHRLMEEMTRADARTAWSGEGGEDMLALWLRWMHNYCRDLFLDHSLRDQLVKQRHFDLVVVDPFSAYCTLVYSKDIIQAPYVFYETAPLYPMLAHFFNIPSPLSYVPVAETGFSDVMSFWERAQNFFLHGVMLRMWSYSLFIEPSDAAVREARATGSSVLPEGAAVTGTADAIRGSSLLVVNTDIALDYPRPTAHNLVYVGGITCKQAAATLPPDLQSAVEASGDAGVIVFSLGTTVTSEHLPPAARQTFLRAFSRLQQTVIWRWDGPPPEEGVPSNVLMREWIPQTDLLGHPKTRAFLCHGGLNGVMEAIHYGVPVVGLPIQGDQLDNVARLATHGAGVLLDRRALTEDGLVEALTQVVYNHSFKSSMMRRSRILHDQPHPPAERLVFWLEYVTRHPGGAAHLTSQAARRLAWYQYHLLDVAGATAALTGAAATVLYCACTTLCRRILRRPPQSKVKTG